MSISFHQQIPELYPVSQEMYETFRDDRERNPKRALIPHEIGYIALRLQPEERGYAGTETPEFLVGTATVAYAAWERKFKDSIPFQLVYNDPKGRLNTPTYALNSSGYIVPGFDSDREIGYILTPNIEDDIDRFIEYTTKLYRL